MPQRDVRMKEFKLTDLEKVGPLTEKKLNKAGIFTPLDIIIRGTKEFSRVSGLSMDMATNHMKTMKKHLADDGNDIMVNDIKSLKALRSRQKRVTLGVPEIDDILNGFETQSIYEVYGSEGCGKTQISMTLAAETLRQGGAMFVDCEGAFDLDRFNEICDAREIVYDEDKLGYHLFGDDTELINGLQNMVEELIERDVTVLVIDGLVGLMRLAYEGRGELNERQIQLKGVLKYLKNLSILLNMCVILTNQVSANPDPFGAKIVPIGGHVLGHYCKYILQITKGMKNNRTLKLIKSPKNANVDMACFINSKGISDTEK